MVGSQLRFLRLTGVPGRRAAEEPDDRLELALAQARPLGIERPNRDATGDALAADAGRAAVAIESGTRKHAAFRYACDHRLRDALGMLADSTRHWHPWAAARYATARARGHDHPRAIRTLGRAWCRVLWRCWQDHAPYDPARHRGLQDHIAVVIPERVESPARPTRHPAARRRRRHPQARARSA